MSEARIKAIHQLLKGIETGDPDSVSVINPEQYIQHNPQTQTGREGLAALFKRLAKTSPRVNIVRAFSDGDFVFAHTEYDFATRRIGFEVFRFEGEMTVEHWDNIQPRQGPNPSEHTMVDGPTEATDLELGHKNRAMVRAFVEEVLLKKNTGAIGQFVSGDQYTEHHPKGRDGLDALKERLEKRSAGPEAISYQQVHRVLAQGNFVLTVCEGQRNGKHSSFYDLYRVESGKIAEHWDTVEAVAPPEQWKNHNGKF